MKCRTEIMGETISLVFLDAPTVINEDDGREATPDLLITCLRFNGRSL